jgi:hypothetical protein
VNTVIRDLLTIRISVSFLRRPQLNEDVVIDIVTGNSFGVSRGSLRCHGNSTGSARCSINLEYESVGARLLAMYRLCVYSPQDVMAVVSLVSLH